jgi:glycosyltransferase involved in cell wall biosynthesis
VTLLVLAPYVPSPPDHGGRIRSQVLLRAARALGPVELLAPVATPEEAALLTALGRDLDLVCHALPVAATTRAHLPRKLATWLTGRSELLQRRWNQAALARAHAMVLRTGWTGVVADSSFALPLLPRDHRTPWVLHLHNVESAILARPDPVRRPWSEHLVRRMEARWLATDEARAAAAARAVITVSEADRAQILELAPKAQVTVVENSVDLARLPILPAPQAGPPRLLFVGSFDYPPNLEAARELLIRHVPVLRRGFPGLRVRLCGLDPAGEVAILAVAHGAEAKGYAQDLLPHYQEATAVYVPLRAGGGTRIKVLEAFALGRPVLASQVAVEGLPVRDGEHYLRVETPEQGAAALLRLPADGHRLIRAARQLVEQRFDHTTAVARLALVLRQAFPPAGRIE